MGTWSIKIKSVFSVLYSALAQLQCAQFVNKGHWKMHTAAHNFENCSSITWTLVLLLGPFTSHSLKKGKITMSGVYVELSSTCQRMHNKITGTQISFLFALPLEIFSAHLSVYVVFYNV
uniref:Secreted protein n=1 Tax=Ixodes ricinus TaxID=34613 RepID=A0A6B0UMT3_IXORI